MWRMRSGTTGIIEQVHEMSGVDAWAFAVASEQLGVVAVSSARSSASGRVVRRDEGDGDEEQRDGSESGACVGGQRSLLDPSVVPAHSRITQRDRGQAGRHGQRVADHRDQHADQCDQSEGEGEVTGGAPPATGRVGVVHAGRVEGALHDGAAVPVGTPSKKCPDARYWAA